MRREEGFSSAAVLDSPNKERVKRVKFDLKLLGHPEEIARKVTRRCRKTGMDKGQIAQAVAGALSTAAKHGTANLFAHLYVYNKGGRLNSSFTKKIERMSNGESRIYSPDVYDIGPNRNWHIEIKSFTLSIGGSSLCSVAQLENYFDHLLRRTDKDPGQRKRSIGFNYAFLRYSVPTESRKVRGKFWADGRPRYKKYQAGPSLSSMQPHELLEFVYNHVNDMIILPPNLLIALFAGSKINVMRQAKSNGDIYSKDFWNLRSGDLTALHKTDKLGIDHVLNSSSKVHDFPFDLSALHLDDLVARHSEYRPLLVNGKYSVEPFPITQYTFRSRKSYRSWIAEFRQNHEEILVEGLGIKDVYAEEARAVKKLPF